MHFLDQRTLGITILVLLAGLVATKKMTTGSILGDRPGRNLWIWIPHLFNLFFLLVINPLTAILLITSHLEAVDSSRLAIDIPWFLMIVEIGGIGLYGMGFLFMSWALIRLRGNYQAGGSGPRVSDEMVMEGPYKLVRHPMYSAALAISLGLACLIQSRALLFGFLIYLGLINFLISAEEKGLRRAYGEPYVAYRQRVKKLVPFSF